MSTAGNGSEGAEMSEPTELDELRRLLSERLGPHVVAVRLAASDQNQGYGFVVTGVVNADGTESRTDPASQYDLLGDEADALLRDLLWDSAVGESPEGYAVLSLAHHLPEGTETVALRDEVVVEVVLALLAGGSYEAASIAARAVNSAFDAHEARTPPPAHPIDEEGTP